MKKLALYYPVKPLFINQAFGGNPETYKQFGIKGHNGIDLMATHGQPVRASHDGMVVYAGMDSNEGVGVVIRTNEEFEYGNESAYYKTVYWHLINNIPVKVGQLVKVGDVIGYADNTGFSTGDHLHFALKPQAKGENDWTWWNLEQDNGYAGAVDPWPYFNGEFAEAQEHFTAEDEKLIKDAIDVATKAINYPILRGATLKLLQWLSAFLLSKKP